MNWLQPLLQVKVQLPPLTKLISFKDPRLLFADNWIALVIEVAVYFALYKAFRHAKHKGTKETFLLISAIIGALGLEFLQQLPKPGYQLWWYHHGIVNIMKHKVPVYIPCLVAVIFYYSDYITRNTKLPCLARSGLNSLLAILLIFPCLILAPNLLIIMVHFGDPMFFDRIMNVPYCQLTYLFLLFFHIGHLFDSFFDEIQPHEKNFLRLLKCSAQSGLVSASYSLTETFVTYIAVKFLLGLNSALCLLFVATTIAWLAKTEISSAGIEGSTKTGFIDTLNRREWRYLVVFFVIISLVPLLVNPESLKSNNERLEMGPCETLELMANMSPLESMRRRYICPGNTAQFGYDFHCVVPEELNIGVVKSEYTICGVAYNNVSQMSVIFIVYSIACLFLFHQVLSVSFKTVHEIKKIKNSKTID